MIADDSRLANLALEVLYSAASIDAENRPWITNLGTGQSTLPGEIVKQLAAQREPIRLIGLNRAGTLAVGWWVFGTTATAQELSARSVRIRALLMKAAEEPGPTVFLKTGDAFHAMDFQTAVRFMTMFEFGAIYSRRICEVYQYELAQLLATQHRAHKKDCVLEFKLQLGSSSQMHGYRPTSL